MVSQFKAGHSRCRLSDDDPGAEEAAGGNLAGGRPVPPLPQLPQHRPLWQLDLQRSSRHGGGGEQVGEANSNIFLYLFV